MQVRPRHGLGPPEGRRADGPGGYSRKHLFEKWMRDSKIGDIYEGTQQIQKLVVARRILDYGRDELA